MEKSAPKNEVRRPLQVNDEAGLFGSAEKQSLLALTQEIAKRRNISIFVDTLHCGQRGRESVQAVDRVASQRLGGFRWSFALSVVQCADSRLLAIRYSFSARPHAIYSKLYHSPEVRRLQLAALEEPRAALHAYLELVEQRFEQISWYSPDATLLAMGLDSELSPDSDDSWLLPIQTAILQAAKLAVPALGGPWATLWTIVLVGLAFRWVALTAARKLTFAIISPARNLFIGYVPTLIVEGLISLPIIGILSAFGGGMLDNQWVVSSLAGQELDRVYDLVFDANARLGELSWLTCILFTLVIVFGYLIPVAIAAYIVMDFGPWGASRVQTAPSLLIPVLQINAVIHEDAAGTYWSYRIPLAIGWFVILTAVPPVVALFLVLRSVMNILSELFDLSGLLGMRYVDQHAAEYFDRNGRLKKPLPRFDRYNMLQPAGMALVLGAFVAAAAVAIRLDPPPHATVSTRPEKLTLPVEGLSVPRKTNDETPREITGQSRLPSIPTAPKIGAWDTRIEPAPATAGERTD